MKKLTTNKEEEINKLPRKDLKRLLKGCLNGNDISSYMEFLKIRDDNMCKVEPGKSHLCSTTWNSSTSTRNVDHSIGNQKE